jgi:hypothetical protein
MSKFGNYEEILIIFNKYLTFTWRRKRDGKEIWTV